MATVPQNSRAARPQAPPDRTRTLSDTPVEKVYTSENVSDLDPDVDLGEAGDFPYTRGIHADMYRGKLWTMRQFSGFATPEETNRRYRYLLDHGQTGLSVAFDLPTLMGYDADDPLAAGEVGKCGVAISSLADMEELFRDIPLAEVTTSMTITSSAAILWAMYLVVAEKQGADWAKISGTIQNDILKEYMAQKEYIYPPRPSMRLVVDTLEFGAEHTPRFNPISISGYHIREAGATALQELVFTLGAGVEYVKWAVERGLDIDQLRPPAELLLRRPQRLLRRDCEVSRGAQDLGQADARTLRRQERAFLEAPLSRPNRRRLAHRATATS